MSTKPVEIIQVSDHGSCKSLKVLCPFCKTGQWLSTPIDEFHPTGQISAHKTPGKNRKERANCMGSNRNPWKVKDSEVQNS